MCVFSVYSFITLDTYIRTYIRTYLLIYVCMYMHFFVCVCVRAFVFSVYSVITVNIHAYLLICIHAYIHTYVPVYVHSTKLMLVPKITGGTPPSTRQRPRTNTRSVSCWWKTVRELGSRTERTRLPSTSSRTKKETSLTCSKDHELCWMLLRREIWKE